MDADYPLKWVNFARRLTGLQTQEKISPEQAEILRRKVISGVCKFISAGAIIPEVEQRSTYNPRLLMAPEKKLLTSTEYSDTEKSSKGHDIKDSTGNVCTIEKDEEDLSDVLESMSEKERNKLLKLLKKGKET